MVLAAASTYVKSLKYASLSSSMSSQKKTWKDGSNLLSADGVILSDTELCSKMGSVGSLTSQAPLSSRGTTRIESEKKPNR